GKKTVAEHVFHRAMNEIKKRLRNRSELEVFHEAIEHAKPINEVRQERVGRATQQVLVQVTSRRQQTLAFRSIIQAARDKKGRPMHLRLADELIAASRRTSLAIISGDFQA